MAAFSSVLDKPYDPQEHSAMQEGQCEWEDGVVLSGDPEFEELRCVLGHAPVHQEVLGDDDDEEDEEDEEDPAVQLRTPIRPRPTLTDGS